MLFLLSRRLGIEVKDFGPSWRSGVAFHSVIHAIRPDLVDMDIVRKRSNRENLEEAFSVAENELGIPCLLDPEGTDMTKFSLKSLQLNVNLQNSTMFFGHGNTMFCRHVQCHYFKLPWIKIFTLLEKKLTEK